MRPRDWMGVVVRGLGLWFIAQGLLVFFDLIYFAIRPATTNPQGWTATDYVISIILHFGVGLTAIGCSEAICGLLYPGRKRLDDEELAE